MKIKNVVIERFVSDEEMEQLKQAYESDEFDYCGYIEKLIKKYEDCFYKDDNGQNEHYATLEAMWKLQRASQIHDWDGVEDELYDRTKKLLLNYLEIDTDNSGSFWRMPKE